MGDDPATRKWTARGRQLRALTRPLRRSFLASAFMLSVLGAFPLCESVFVAAPAHAQGNEPKRFSIVIKQRQVEPDLRVIRALQGDTLEITITTDEPAELHLHGYDVLLSVEPGKPAAIHLVAKIAGRFSLEAHRFGAPGAGIDPRRQKEVTLLYLEIYPR
jgi:hypothetical protein